MRISTVGYTMISCNDGGMYLLIRTILFRNS